MAVRSLAALVQEQLRIARETPSGRSARTIIGGPGHTLRQTVLALRAGHALAEHESPGEATLQVLHGHVVLSGGTDVQEGATGDIMEIPLARHRLEARADAVVLLTVALAEGISSNAPAEPADTTQATQHSDLVGLCSFG